jgi:hypothetical protein
MMVALRGSSPATMAAGILLLSRARSFGQRIQVEIVGDPGDVGVVTGPAILHSAPVASCGVGRELGSGALVVVPGPIDAPLAVSLSPDGRRDWFFVDRTGEGHHPATREFVRLTRSRSPASRAIGRALLDALDTLGCAAEPAVLDLLFGAPVPPLTRLSVALRAGRALAGARGRPINEFLAEGDTDQDEGLDRAGAIARLHPAVRARAEDLVDRALALPAAEGGPPEALLDAMTDILRHFALLPRQVMLPPLDPAMDAVAHGLGRALAATSGNPEAQAALMETYRFLGGKFTTRAEHALALPATLPPADRLGRWAWFCSHVSEAAGRMESIWRDLVDPPM